MGFVVGVVEGRRRIGDVQCCSVEGDRHGGIDRRKFSAALVSAAVVGFPYLANANVGGKDRCDAAFDVNCGSDGVKLKSLEVYPPPKLADFEVTDRVFMEFSAAGSMIGRITIGLFRNAAPTSVDVFARMVEGRLTSGLSYASSQVFKVEKDKRIDLGRLAKGAGKTEVRSIDYSGYVRRKYVSTADRGTENSDGNSLRHNAPGLVSMVKGGGSFEFVITPSPTPDPTLDDDHIVIGQVLEGMDVVARLNNLAVNKPTSYKNTFISMGKAINDKRATAAEDDNFKPLQKTVIKYCGILS